MLSFYCIFNEECFKGERMDGTGRTGRVCHDLSIDSNVNQLDQGKKAENESAATIDGNEDKTH